MAEDQIGDMAKIEIKGANAKLRVAEFLRTVINGIRGGKHTDAARDFVKDTSKEVVNKPVSNAGARSMIEEIAEKK